MEWGRKIGSKELSGALILIFTIFFLQLTIFLFSPGRASDKREKPEKLENELQTGSAERKDARLSEPVNDTKSENDNSTLGGKRTKIIKEGSSLQQKRVPELFAFDPNTVNQEQLQQLGMSQRQAEVIINFRSKGGVFKNRDDFKKIYSVSEQFYNRVKDSIVIQVKRIDINTADSAALISLKGIGPYYASQIIRYRDKIGWFVNTAQLMEIKGIDNSRYRLFEDDIFVDTACFEKRYITEISQEQLSDNPYIGKFIAHAIIRFSEITSNKQVTINELLTNSIIKPQLLEILSCYFK